MQPAAFFAGINEFSRFRDIIEQFGVGEVVVDHHFRMLQQIFTPQGDQAGIARPCANQINFAVGLILLGVVCCHDDWCLARKVRRSLVGGLL